jgi:hypothetical protein
MKTYSVLLAGSSPTPVSVRCFDAQGLKSKWSELAFRFAVLSRPLFHHKSYDNQTAPLTQRKILFEVPVDCRNWPFRKILQIFRQVSITIMFLRQVILLSRGGIGCHLIPGLTMSCLLVCPVWEAIMRVRKGSAFNLKLATFKELVV